jgi:hypothetical protein
MRHWCPKRGPVALRSLLQNISPSPRSIFSPNPTLSDHQNQITAKTPTPLLRRHLVFCTRSIAAGIVFRYIPVFDIISLAPVSTICGDTLLHSSKKKGASLGSLFPRHEEAINFDDSHNSTPSASTLRRLFDRIDRI